MQINVNIEYINIQHLEDTMIMYGVYNSNTLEQLIETVHEMYERLNWQEKAFVGTINEQIQAYLNLEGVNHYAINSLLFLTTVREKCVNMYKRFIEQLKMYARAIRVLSKGYLPVSLLPPSRLQEILMEVKKVLQTKNKDYELVLTQLYLYYGMKLVTFGIDEERNLIIQFLVFVQPYTQKQLNLYQIETVPVPILDKIKQADLFTQLKIDRPYIAVNSETYISLTSQELAMCKKDRS